ncbi:hypothetical protein MRX96_037571 [Rhipicephalus microplus]
MHCALCGKSSQSSPAKSVDLVPEKTIDDLEMTVVRCKPETISVLCKSTKFSKEEIKRIYQGFKQSCPTGLVNENTFKDMYCQFFPLADPRTAAGKPVPRLPSTGIGRRARAFLLRLRAGCGRTAQLLTKRRGSGSPSCVQCPAEETVEHILCLCPGYADIRRRLCDSYGKLGLPHVSAEHLLFPSANVATLRRAFYALLDFFGDANLFMRL